MAKFLKDIFAHLGRLQDHCVHTYSQVTLPSDRSRQVSMPALWGLILAVRDHTALAAWLGQGRRSRKWRECRGCWSAVGH